MNKADFSNVSKNIHVNLKNKVEHNVPFPRVSSTNCQVWFKAAGNLIKDQKENGTTCGNCNYFIRYVKRMDKKNSTADD